MRKVIHKTCDGQVGWVHGDSNRVIAAEFERMDGTYPEALDMFRIKCPKCGESIRSPYEVRLDDTERPA